MIQVRIKYSIHIPTNVMCNRPRYVMKQVTTVEVKKGNFIVWTETLLVGQPS